ncbi:unnamed protein product, partial [Rotaria sp. Silwood1]
MVVRFSLVNSLYTRWASQEAK